MDPAAASCWHDHKNTTLAIRLKPPVFATSVLRFSICWCPGPHLHGLHYVQVGHVLVSQLGVLGQMHILLGHHDALLEEELIDSNAVLLGHQHLQANRGVEKGVQGTCCVCPTNTKNTLTFFFFFCNKVHENRVYITIYWQIGSDHADCQFPPPNTWVSQMYLKKSFEHPPAEHPPSGHKCSSATCI